MSFLQQISTLKNKKLKFRSLLSLLVIVILMITLFVEAPRVSAQSGEEGVSFGIRPTVAFENRPETYSYFSYGLAPGVQMNDVALVMNSGTQAITLTIYAADGTTAQNGGTAFTEKGELSSGGSQGVSSWIQLGISELYLEPGEEVEVPFIVNVPPDATSGHHIAGLVVESSASDANLPEESNDSASFAVVVVKRVGVAIVIDVPGVHTAGLAIESLSFHEQDENGARFILAVHNSGNTFIKAEGILTISDTNDEKLAEFPYQLDTVLPGDRTIFYLSFPIVLTDSDYLLSASLIFGEGETKIADAEINLRDGQLVIDDAIEDSLLPPTITEIGPTEIEFSISEFIYKYRFILFGTLAFLGLIEVVVLIIYFLRKRNK